MFDGRKKAFRIGQSARRRHRARAQLFRRFHRHEIWGLRHCLTVPFPSRAALELHALESARHARAAARRTHLARSIVVAAGLLSPAFVAGPGHLHPSTERQVPRLGVKLHKCTPGRRLRMHGSLVVARCSLGIVHGRRKCRRS